MTCSLPPPLTPDQLSAAIDGTAAEEVDNHLRDCADCRQRLANAQALEQQLHRHLLRWDCPSPQQLADFHLGLLEPQAADLGLHIVGCARCQAELAELRGFLAAGNERPARVPAPQPDRRARAGLREILAQLLPQTPALALRGESQAPLMAAAGEVLVIVETQAAGGTYTLVGQVAAPAQDEWNGALAQLAGAGEITHSAVVDELGGFRLAGVPAGTHTLRLTPRAGNVIVLPTLDLGGKASGI